MNSLIESNKQTNKRWKVGGLPRNITSFDLNATTSVEAALSYLTSFGNVHMVPAGDLARSIAALGINPRVSFQKNDSSTSWYSLVRERLDGSSTYIYVYNDATGLKLRSGASSGNITIEYPGVPYFYDAWTGTETPAMIYSQEGRRTTIPLSLAGNQTTIIVLKHKGRPPCTSVRQSDHPVQVHTPWLKPSNGKSILVCPNRISCQVQLSDGRSLSVPSSWADAPLALANWTLTLESWQAPSNLSHQLPEDTVKVNTTYQIAALRPWNELTIANLSYVSGRGFYQSTFSWPPPGSSNGDTAGAVLDLGPVLHTAVAYINGRRLPPLDITAAQADISKYIHEGDNVLDVVVSTPLGNALVPLWDTVLSAGNHARITFWNGSPTYGVREYGLVGEVVVRPYSGVAI